MDAANQVSVNVKHSASKECYISAYRYMLLGRMLDEKIANLYRSGKIFGGVFSGKGQESLSAASAFYLQKEDIYAPLIRDTTGRLIFGETILDAVRTHLGSPLGPIRGRDGNVHRGRPKEGVLAMISHLGAMLSVVNGRLMAHRYKGIKNTVGVACIGDGASSTGSTHEAINQAAVERLPVIIVLANNQYAYSTPCSRQYACKNLLDRAVGYGIEGHSADGTDLDSCLLTMEKAIQRARSGHGPQLVVAELLRLCGHGEHDDAQYVSKELKQSHWGRDCLKVSEQALIERGWSNQRELDIWREEAARQIENVVATVQNEPQPDPAKENWTSLVSDHLKESYDECYSFI